MLTSASKAGSSTERRTSIWAAWWTRISMPDSRTRSAASCERMSRTWSSAPGGTFSRRPPDRLSMISTRRPWARKASATWEPMNPAPPVTQTVPWDRSLLMATGAYSKSRARTGGTCLSDRASRADRAVRDLPIAVVTDRAGAVIVSAGSFLQIGAVQVPQRLRGEGELLGCRFLLHFGSPQIVQPGHFEHFVASLPLWPPATALRSSFSSIRRVSLESVSFLDRLGFFMISPFAVVRRHAYKGRVWSRRG